MSISWKLVKKKKSELTEYFKNPRYLTEDDEKQLRTSVDKFGLIDKPIVNTDGTIIGGHQRLKVLDTEEIEVWIPERKLTEKEVEELNLRLNKNQGRWDDEILAKYWDPQLLEEVGWTKKEIDKFPVEEPEAHDDQFEIPEEVETDIQPGDLIAIGEHRLLCGDSTSKDHSLKLMGGKQMDLMITDPPYNVDYQGKGAEATPIMNDKMNETDFYKFIFDFYDNFIDFTKAGRAWYVFHADSMGHIFRQAFIDCGMDLKQTIIWAKNALVMGRQDYHWKHEPILYGWKPGAAHYFINERDKTTVWEEDIDLTKLTKKQLVDIFKTVNTTILKYDRPSKNDLHPTMKPILLLAHLMANSSRKGELVVDPFLGSGSTMVTAHQMERKCYGLELDPKFCQVIVDRMRKLDPTLKITINGTEI